MLLPLVSQVMMATPSASVVMVKSVMSRLPFAEIQVPAGRAA
jgi:hypothetical protein